MEFPTAPNVRKEVIFHPGKDIGMTCFKTHQELYNGLAWELMAVGEVDSVVRNSQAGRAGVKQHYTILSVAGQEEWNDHRLWDLAKGDDEFTVMFDCHSKAMAAWCPLRKTSASRARIVGACKESGGIRIEMEDSGQEIVVRKGQLAVRHTQTGRPDDRFARHRYAPSPPCH